MSNPPENRRTFDLERVVERCLGNRDLAVSLLQRFGTQLTTDVPRLADAVNRAVPGDVAQAAHRIKGAAATLGIDGVQQMAAWIENAARSGELSGTAERLRALQTEADNFRNEVSRSLS